MDWVKNTLKKVPYYRDLKHVYFLYSLSEYTKGNRFLYYRFWINSKMKRRQHALDKPVQTKQYTMHLLCGHQDINQLYWALASWYYATSESPQVYIHDDGTLRRRDCSTINTLFPHAKIVEYAAATQQASNTWLKQFPRSLALRTGLTKTNPARRIDYPFALKLLDPYFVSNADYVYLLDTDILWFRQPDTLLDAIYNYRAPIFWQDTSPCPSFFENGESLRNDLLYYNGGLVFYRKQDFDLNILEEYLQKRGTNRDAFFGFSDQPAFAYMFGQYGQTILLPTDCYHIKGKINDSTVSIHYLSQRRAKFWIEGVRFLYQKHLLVEGI